MKILFLTENFPPESNAAANRVYERACYWAKWGHDVTVITSAPNFPQGVLHQGFRNRWYQTESMDGIEVVRVKTFISPNRGTLLRMLDFLSFMITGFCAALVHKRPDVIVATSPQFFTAVAGRLASAVKRTPLVFELGDIWPASIVAVGAMEQSFIIRLMEKFELFLYRRSDSVAALTGAFKANLIRRGIKGDKISVVMNGVDLARYRPRDPDENLAKAWNLDGKFVVGYIGTHGMAHGLMNVLDAAELLRDESRICFLLVGDGAERANLVRAVQDRNLGNVVLIPAQPKEELPRIWSICDVALVHLRGSPVFSEVIPSKTFEAMAMGRPVLLATPSGEASRILAEDKAGLHVPPEDPEALAAAVKRMAYDEGLLKNYAEGALAA
ncbi:MAG: glycosyltransferase family 4 protein, partial [Rhodospirillaceae bacterium]|nr:glycosyltransferase family 4 protein [Rhodospirillaceae bacterium]